MIELSGVHRSFVESQTGAVVEAVGGFDLRVAAGEFVALLGPSGCGKTSVLRLIAGHDPGPVQGGAVRVGGAPVAGISPRRVLVAQDAALFPWLNVEENIGFGLRAQGRPNPGRVHELIQQMGLSGAERRLPAALSGGMRQRVALARALAIEPEVLLLDEPFAALDAISREQLQDVLEAAWQRAGTTVVLVTHAVDEALRLADRVVVVSQRPARVVHDLRVSSPRPRDVSQLGEQRRWLTGLLRAPPAGEPRGAHGDKGAQDSS